jgi:hypothetical protein
MRFIDVSLVGPDAGWLARAATRAEQVRTAQTDEARRKAIEDGADIWRELRPWLEGLSHGKCWYTDASNIVAVSHVDHFRPKATARDLQGNITTWYWWLAFDWKNYRLCGEICNVRRRGGDGEPRGKGDSFPLQPGCTPATGPGDDLEDEVVLLLDPTSPGDPALLTFDASGMPLPTAPSDTWNYERADATIKLLHLDHYLLVDERKKVWNKCTRLASRALYCWKKHCKKPDAAVWKRFLDCCLELRYMVSPKASLSCVAKACLLSPEWVDFYRKIQATE